MFSLLFIYVLLLFLWNILYYTQHNNTIEPVNIMFNIYILYFFKYTTMMDLFTTIVYCRRILWLYIKLKEETKNTSYKMPTKQNMAVNELENWNSNKKHKIFSR